MDKKLNLLLYDTRYLINQPSYIKLLEQGHCLTRLSSLNNIKDYNTNDFDGIIAHPGIHQQRNFMKEFSLMPNLRIAIVSVNDVESYKIYDGRVGIFSIRDLESIISHFKIENNK